MYSIETICSLIKGKFLQRGSDIVIEYLVNDSRRVQQPSLSLFFAIKTQYNDGHKYLNDVYRKGVRNFIISEDIPYQELKDASVIYVADVLAALQELAKYHRQQFSLPVIGITGSNGKTIVKEWLYELLHEEFKIIRSPKSYNSQLGVPLSIWQINIYHTLGIFEAGISRPGEMENLEKIIQPTIGILTNIGEAHSANFLSENEKLKEKLKLFDGTDVLICEHKLVKTSGIRARLFTWGSEQEATLHIKSIERKRNHTSITAVYKGFELAISIPFTDDASIQNAINCWCVLIYLDIDKSSYTKKFDGLHTVDMRLQLKHGINGCMVINDSYSADLTSLKIALDFLMQQATGLSKTVILSDFIDSGYNDELLYHQISELLQGHKVKKVIAIGDKISGYFLNHASNLFSVETYSNTDDYIKSFFSSSFLNEIILIKGARKFQFERIAQLFEKRLHDTVLEINLNALAQNLKEYQKLLLPGTKIMGMVKAFSYGSGGSEIASVLQYHNVDYLGVAYADEGAELVKAGIQLPIMVINTEENSFKAIVDFQLEPVIYSFDILEKFESYLLQQGLTSWPVHVEIETGMNRLGFALEEVEKLARHFTEKKVLNIQSVFTHLAASEDPEQDNFTLSQLEIFNNAVQILERYISYPFLKHIANSAAVVRHPRLHLDMVRLGIGLYGIEVDTDHKLDLMPVATLRSTIAQVKHVKMGESVSYNRMGIVNRDSIIATVRIGYADGYSRQLGNGKGKMMIRGNMVPVIGSVCMDMTMVDVTDVKHIKEGDDVIIFGKTLPVQEVAAWINTIPYELMTSVSQRVKRIYFHD